MVVSKLILLAIVFELSFAIEQPSYQVLNKIDSNVEIRKYEPSKWVSTSMIGSCQNAESLKSTLFQRLFRYISGNNDKNQKVEMTSPVLTEIKSLSLNDNLNCQITMRFYLPKVNQANTPVPTDGVYLEKLEELTVAIIQFPGFATMTDYIKNRDLLSQKLAFISQQEQFNSANMLTAGYDSPYELAYRKNEVWFRKM